ncbi:MAG: thioesterase family protein [Acidimicrobiia bacterium]|nr:thioesterase family protein [Acidimicrobiia bacterium]
MTISVGDTVTLGFTVHEEDTAIAVGSGDVPVLGTPRLVAWCEAATVAAATDGLGAGQTTVGTNVSIDHLAPTAVGGSVSVMASVSAVDGRQITYEVSAVDDNGPIGQGTVTRVVVDRERFISRL